LCNLVDKELKSVLTLEEGQLKVLENASISAINSTPTPSNLTETLSAYFKALKQAKDRRELARTLERSKDALISAIAKKKPRRKQLTRSDELINATPDKDDRSTWEIIRNTRTLLPPSAAIAGIYASVDRTRGVWKAPANVALSGVIGPSVELSAKEHGELNDDSQNGKSINVIKSNSAGDVLVMGARTMDGNSNEWRFVSTRRFFIMVEESIANSVQWAVFEPNDANTWARVQSSVENFLTQKWREGALFGGSPAEAFSVSVGLGRTMTADDILKGIMRVNIAMRVVTPAEVVELRFSHKIIK
jgi:phage tail sheath protein FI